MKYVLILILLCSTPALATGSGGSTPNIPCYDAVTGEMIATSVTPPVCEQELGGTITAPPSHDPGTTGMEKFIYGLLGTVLLAAIIIAL